MLRWLNSKFSLLRTLSAKNYGTICDIGVRERIKRKKPLLPFRVFTQPSSKPVKEG